MNHPSVAELEAGVINVLDSPRERGILELIVSRPAVDEREILEAATLDLAKGLVGDSWKARSTGVKKDAARDRQVTVMNARAAALVAGPKSRWAVAGDQLYVDFDLSETNLPVGARLAIGSAVIQIASPPHTGCAKFAARFGDEARRFVNSPIGKSLHLRGVNARVVTPGTVRTGDVVEKLGEEAS